MAGGIEKIEHDIVSIKLDASMTHNDTQLIKIRTEKLESIQDEVSNLYTGEDSRAHSLIQFQSV